MSERLPPPSAARIRDTQVRAEDLLVLPKGTRLMRVHDLAGPWPTSWDQFRAWGPTASRFDHHPTPTRAHTRRRVAYLTHGANAFTAALAEHFQDGAGGVLPLDLSRGRPAVSLVDTVHDITLLDLDGGWVTRAGGNQSIRTGSRARSRHWARAIYSAHRSVQGLAYSSSVWGPGRCVALWERAERAFPTQPTATRTLDDPAMAPALATAAEALGTFVV